MVVCGYVKLVGTEDQVVEADHIRQSWVKEVYADLQKRYARSRSYVTEATMYLVQTVNRISDAAWWIENRDDLGKKLLPELHSMLRSKKGRRH